VSREAVRRTKGSDLKVKENVTKPRAKVQLIDKLLGGALGGVIFFLETKHRIDQRLRKKSKKQTIDEKK